MDDDNIESNYIINDNNNISKIYSDEVDNTNTKDKIANKKTKKKGKITNKMSNEQENSINNDNEIDKDNQEEIKHLDVILQDNKSSKRETIEDILNKEARKKILPPINIEKNNIENSNKEENSASTPNMNINKYLKIQIDEKTKQIEELSLSQDLNKKSLTEILKKINITIETNGFP